MCTGQFQVSVKVLYNLSIIVLKKTRTHSCLISDSSDILQVDISTDDVEDIDQDGHTYHLHLKQRELVDYNSKVPTCNKCWPQNLITFYFK